MWAMLVANLMPRKRQESVEQPKQNESQMVVRTVEGFGEAACAGPLLQQPALHREDVNQAVTWALKRLPDMSLTDVEVLEFWGVWCEADFPCLAPCQKDVAMCPEAIKRRV
ncbi:hypothetical protein AK812_SmicGene43344 [Symbiodinium microadriaticum]|uniref:Uncharacterized protein n=1 Tax=Symbiodinium microadriaticum TaxID=2951 RepID=A0A1Q9C198_SYMMI|nr:hypothetical protein AK812_SmicGene43344 [Symbiodinium microadriaticum]CAE7234212.1 unnamed protein product [Symbiodinium microadriaticum]